MIDGKQNQNKEMFKASCKKNMKDAEYHRATQIIDVLAKKCDEQWKNSDYVSGVSLNSLKIKNDNGRYYSKSTVSGTCDALKHLNILRRYKFNGRTTYVLMGYVQYIVKDRMVHY